MKKKIDLPAATPTCRLELEKGNKITKKQQDARKVYEALACKEFDPKLNHRHEGGNIVPN